MFSYKYNMSITEKPSLEQKIARAEAELARLRKKNRAIENGQKIILGNLVLNAARRHANVRSWLLEEIRNQVERPVDRQRLQSLIDELIAMPQA